MKSTNKIVLGNGLLGKELVKQSQWYSISRDMWDENYFWNRKDSLKFEFTDLESYQGALYWHDIIINCIANTDTYGEDRDAFMDVNFKAVCDLVGYCNKNKKKLVQISTDYIYAGSVPFASETDMPVPAKNWYTYSKLLADEYVQVNCKDYLVIRTSFKPKPFPYLKAITTQIGNFDYVDVIAGLIIRLINGGAKGVFNVGTETKTIYELAKQTSSAIPSNEILHPSMPTDITMNLSKMKEFLHEN